MPSVDIGARDRHWPAGLHRRSVCPSLGRSGAQFGPLAVMSQVVTLHGRAAYRGQRRLGGACLNREDFESRLRLLRASRPDLDEP